MFAFLNEGSVALRFSAANREGFIKKYHASLFETFCTVMKEYVTISPALFKKAKALRPCVLKGYDYSKTLKAKPTKNK